MDKQAQDKRWNELSEVSKGITRPLVKWEYTYYKSSLLSEDDLLVRLNEVGEEGWELVQILKNTIVLTFIFKRKIQQE